MRLTTKIVLGIIAFITLISIISIFALSFADKNQNNFDLNISEGGETTSIDIPLHKTVVLEMDDDINNTEQAVYVNSNGMMNFRPITNEADRNKLVIPKQLEPFIDISELNGTLKIYLRTNDLLAQHNITNERSHLKGIGGIDITLFTDSSVNFVSKAKGMGVSVENLDVDRIDLNILLGSIKIENCKANIITPLIRGRWQEFLIKDSQTKELNIDLDQIGNWRVEGCDIEVENLTGSSNHDVNLPKSESRVMNWIPKTKEATLSVQLGADIARVTFP